jgi:hypothetical protein
MFRSALLLCTFALALTACSPEPASHASYGQDCVPVAQYEYRGFCLPDAGPGTTASGIGRGGAGRSSSRDPQDGETHDAAAGDAEASDPTAGGDAASGDTRDAGQDGTDPTPACAGDTAQAESCNGLDDDCDKRSDESIEESCYEGAAGCAASGSGYECSGLCRAGVRRCVAGELGECEGQRTPASMESCTDSGELAADEDCDGAIDEDCPCTEPSQACYSGSAETRDVGPCRAGLQNCDSSGFGDCEGEVLPGVETCANAGMDDDCDGRLDDVPTVGSGCTDATLLGPCRVGTWRCDGDGLVCDTPAPSPETCDGADNDCNGRSDETFDLQTDRDHCGECGRACNGAQSCCAGSCVDLGTSTDHCGECGNDCAAGYACCGAACQDLQNDPAHCGACNRVCGSGQSCCGGACVDTTSNADHCGICGNVCGSGQSCCDGACYDLDTAADHCGSCTHSCVSVLEGCCRGACRLLSLGC